MCPDGDLQSFVGEVSERRPQSSPAPPAQAGTPQIPFPQAMHRRSSKVCCTLLWVICYNLGPTWNVHPLMPHAPRKGESQLLRSSLWHARRIARLLMIWIRQKV